MCFMCVCVYGSPSGACIAVYFGSIYALSAFATVTQNLHAILRFANAYPIWLFISVPAGNMRITTAWGPDETDLGVNELLTDRQWSSVHLN